MTSVACTSTRASTNVSFASMRPSSRRSSSDTPTTIAYALNTPSLALYWLKTSLTHLFLRHTSVLPDLQRGQLCVGPRQRCLRCSLGDDLHRLEPVVPHLRIQQNRWHHPQLPAILHRPRAHQYPLPVCLALLFSCACPLTPIALLFP